MVCPFLSSVCVMSFSLKFLPVSVFEKGNYTLHGMLRDPILLKYSQTEQSKLEKLQDTACVKHNKGIMGIGRQHGRLNSNKLHVT